IARLPAPEGEGGGGGLAPSLAARGRTLARARKKKPARRGKPHVVHIGPREVETRGLAQGFWTDLYHRSMTVHWPAFFGFAALIFVVLNAVFALLYWLGATPIANVNPD